MKRMYTVPILCVCFLSTVTLLFSQQTPGEVGLGVHGSVIKLIGGETDQSVVDFASGLDLEYVFSEHWNADLSLGIGWVRPRTSDSYFEVAGGYRTYLYPANLLFRYHPNPALKFNPYAGLGAGLMMWDLRDVSNDDAWFPIPPSGVTIHGRQTNMTLLLAAGSLITLSDKLLLDVGLRYSRLLDQPLNNINMQNDNNTGLAEFRLGLLFRFGKTKDSDFDGIPDKKDLAPTLPEDFDGFEDEDGAPDLDNDGDGIPDIRDKAPNAAEDMDGFQDDDGVPDLDNDGDGIPDVRDGAPNLPEDFDGFQDEDGVPDLDNDGDGIPDVKDECPNEPETVNGYEDSDGCPDEKPVEKAAVEESGVIMTVGQRIILPAVQFASGSAALNQAAQDAIKSVIVTLKQKPALKVEIRGYTDSIGNAASNLALSQRRADAVKRLMVNSDIAADRINAVGYGQANPIASNQTTSGRAQNRRIEIWPVE